MVFTRKRKRSNSIRARKRRRTTTVQRRRRMPILITPSSKTVKLKYTASFSFDPGTGGIAAQVFRANSLFDPDQTGVGGQPDGFDQWGAFYKTYHVYGSTCQVSWLPHANNTTNVDMYTPRQGMCGLRVAHGVTTPTYADALLTKNQPLTRCNIMSGSAARGSRNGCVNQRITFNSRKFFGHRRNSDTEANWAANPGEIGYFQLYYWNPYDVNANPGLVHAVVTITFYARFDERITNIYDA